MLLLLIGFSSLGAAAKLGYALSGGGARGFAHLGVLKVLEEYGIQPDYICGTSMGAVIGALYAQGYDAQSIQDMLLQVKWQDAMDDSYKRKELHIGQKRWAPHGVVSFGIDDLGKIKLPSSVWVANRLNLELAKLFAGSGSDVDFTRFPIPFSCVATDLLTGEKVVFTKGNLMQAVRASLSVPSILEPFELDGHLYIDGGVSQNLPAAETKEMGADFVIGIKTNSPLRPKEELRHFVTVFDQTLNISMINSLNRSLDSCDLLLEPDLEGFTAMDYDKAVQIIDAAEAYARAHLAEIMEFYSLNGLELRRRATPRKAAPMKLSSIVIIGNEHLSDAKIREFLGLEIGGQYSAAQIVNACSKAWNSQLFHTIYPIMEATDDGHLLTLHVKEEERSQLSVLLSYTSEEGLQAGGIIKMQNILLKNSSLMAGLNLGGKNEYNIDYVKNFGERWGAYFRLFHYLSARKRYYYDADFNKAASIRAREIGVTAGLGIFASKYIVAESFLYSYRTRMLQDISTVADIDSLYLISGAGVKLYHESLDDYYFPLSGLRASLKFNFARSGSVSDYIYSKVQGSAELYSPISNRLSLKLRLDAGSWFDRQLFNIDPFYVGGSSGYKGYHKYQVSAPVYKMADLGLVSQVWKKLFVSAGAQGLIIDEIDTWTDSEIVWCGYVGAGINTPLGPLRASFGIREGGKPNLYINFGYDLDVFHFSRK
ncbi:MAG TPA: BamA/TamA family outer membrane protein [Candidatus Cloacimonetes bacterium]|nr:hypothetical protein [Candidatus Cloacimonas sp.]HHZ14774.1 BamA/TamA family outer membrane protein [Candidatus Cloacimonadota bacterium]